MRRLLWRPLRKQRGVFMGQILRIGDRPSLNETLIAYSEEGTPLMSLSLSAGTVTDPLQNNNKSGGNSIIRVEWPEIRSGEAYRVIAEKQPGECWEFWEKSMYEVKWYRMTSTADRIDKADGLIAELQPPVDVKAAKAA